MDVAPGLPILNTSGSATGGQAAPVQTSVRPVIAKLSKAYRVLPMLQPSCTTRNTRNWVTVTEAGNVNELQTFPPLAPIESPFTEPYTTVGSVSSIWLLLLTLVLVK